MNRNEIGVAGFVGGVAGGVAASVVSSALSATMASGWVNITANAIASGATGGKFRYFNLSSVYVGGCLDEDTFIPCGEDARRV